MLEFLIRRVGSFFHDGEELVGWGRSLGEEYKVDGWVEQEGERGERKIREMVLVEA